MKSPFLPLLSLLPIAAAIGISPAAQAQDERSLKLYDVLLKRPSAGPVFEQLQRTWLETDTLEKLEEFLHQRAGSSPEARMVLAGFLERRGSLESALAEWDRVTTEAPAITEAWRALAALRTRMRDENGALTAIARGLESAAATPARRPLLEMQARLLARSQRQAEARKVWEELMRQFPDDQDLREDFVELLAQSGEMDAAVQAARALAEATQDAYRRVLRRTRAGDLLARQGAAEAALAEYRTALRDTGAGSWLERDLLRQIDALFRRADRVSDLAAFMEKLAAEEPQRLSVRRSLAQLFAAQGNREAADREWRSLLAAAPGDKELVEAFVQSLTENGRHEEAAEQWRALLKIHPGDAELHLRLAEALFAARDAAGGAEAVRAFILAKDATEAAMLRGATELMRLKQPAEGAVLLTETVEKFPDSEQASQQLAAALHRAGRKDEARAAWRTGARRQLLPAARAASAAGEHALAWELLAPRTDEFARDATALTFLSEAAGKAEQCTAALAQAQRLLLLAADAPSQESASALVLRCAARAGQSDSLRRDLESRRASLTLPEKLLLAELLHAAGMRSASVALAEEVAADQPALSVALLVRLHAAAQEWNGAISAQLRLMQSDSSPKPAAVQRLAELCRFAGRKAEALRWTGEWRRLAPGATAPWLAEATLLEQNNRHADAVVLLEQAIHRWPDDTVVLERLAALYSESGRGEEAQEVHLRLYEMAEGTEEKLRRLPAMIHNAQSVLHRLDSLTDEFERRRAQNRLSPAPLLALAELAARSEQPRRRLELLQEAARLGPGDAALLMRAAEAAASDGFDDLALSILTDAAALDKTGAAQQQRAVLLLKSGHQAEAGAILKQAAASLTLEEAGETAAVLAQLNHPAAAAHLLGGMLERFPDNYRLAWLRVELLARNTRDAGLVEEYVRLATTSFPPMPVVDFEYQNGLPYERPPGGPALEPQLDWRTTADLADDVRTTRAFLETWPQRENRNRPTDSLPPAPGQLAQLRGWAARRALVLAHSQAPDTVPAVQDQLLKAGLSVALLTPSLIVHGVNPDRAEVDRLYAQHPEHRAWLLRFIYEEIPARYGHFPNLAAAELQPDYLAAEKPDVPRPSFAEAWRVFRESDPAYAVYVALQLANSMEGVSRQAAEEALAMLERSEGPGAALRGVVPHMGLALYSRNQNQGPLLSRLLSRLDAWAASAPPGPVREELMWMRLQRDWGSGDPAAYLKLVAEQLQEGRAFAAPNHYLPPWPVPAQPPPWPQRAQTISDLTKQGIGWPMVSNMEGGQLPGPGAWLLQVPPAVPPHAQSRLLHAVMLLVPGKWSEDAAKLRTALEACNDPGLKAVASLSLPDAGFTSACMDALTTPPDAPPDALLLAAAWAWKQHQPEKAVTLLERYSAQEPADAPRLADTGIVAAAHLLLWAGEQVSEPVRRSTAAALERLSAHAFQPELLRSLARVASKLALTERSASLLATALNSPPPVAMRGPESSATTKPHALSGLIESLQRRQGAPDKPVLKTRDPAAWVQSLLDQAKMSAGEWGQRPQPDLELNAYMLNQDKSLEAVVLKALRERAEKAQEPRDRWFAGLALLGCNEGKTAATAMRRACALMPEEKKLHFLAARWLATSGQMETAKEMLEGLSRYQRAAVLAAAIASYDAGILRLPPALDLADQWLAALRDLHDHVDSLTDEDRADFYNSGDTTQQALNSLETRRGGAGIPGLPGFFDSPSTEELAAMEQDPKLAALAKRRRELLPVLYRELIRSPLASAAAFAKMEHAARILKIEWPQMLDDALLSLTASPASRLHLYANSGQFAPQQVVLRELVRRPAWLEETLLPVLRRANRDQLADSLVRLAPLLTCTEAEFVRLVKENGGPSEREARANYGATVMEIITQRGLTAVLPELITREITEQREDWHGSLGMTKLIGPAMDALFARGGQAALDAWVRNLCGEGQPEDIWSRPGSPEAVPGKGFMRLLNALHRAAQSPAEVVAAVRLRRALSHAVAALPARALARYLTPVEPPSLASFTASDVVSILETLGMTGSAVEFCEGLDQWRTERDPAESIGRFSQWLGRNERRQDNSKTGLLETALAAKYPDSFGGKLCVALLRENAGPQPPVPENEVRVAPARPLEVISAHLAELKALPEAEQIKLAMPPPAVPNGAVIREPDSAALAAKQWQQHVALRHDRQRLEEVLAKDPAEIIFNHPTQAELKNVIGRLLPEDPDRIIALVKRIHAAAAGSGMYSQLVPQLLQFTPDNNTGTGDPAASARQLRALLKLSAAAPDLGFPAEAWLHPLQETLRLWLMPRAISQPGAPVEKITPLQRFIAGVESNPDGIPTDDEVRGLLPLLLDAVASFTGHSDSDETVPAAAARLREPGPGGNLRRAAAAALTLGALHRERQLIASRRQEDQMTTALQAGARDFHPRHLQNTPLDGITDTAALTPEQRELLAFLKDAALPVEVRSQRIQRGLAQFPRLFDPPLLAAAAELLPAPGAKPSRRGDLTFAVNLASVPSYFTPAADGSDRDACAKLMEALQPQASKMQGVDLLQLAIRSGNEAAVMKAARSTAAQREAKLSGVFCTLVNHRQFASAQWLLENAGDKLFAPGATPLSPGELYGPVTPQALRDFQEALPEGPLRTVARVLVESAHDAPALSGTAIDTQSRRLAALLQVLPQENLPPEWLRRLQGFFAGRRDFEEALRAMQATAMEKAPVTEMLHADETTRKMFLGHLARQAQLGQMAALTKTLDEILAAPGDHKATARELLAYVRAAHQPVRRDWPPDAEAAGRALMRRRALDPALHLKEKPAQMAFVLAECIAIHAAADAMKEMEEAWNAVPAEHRAVLESLPQVVPYILQHIHDPAADRFSGRSVPALPADLIGRREEALMRLLRSTGGMPGLLPGDLYAWEAREAVTFADNSSYAVREKLCALAPELLARRDRQALTALADIALMLVKEKKADEAGKLVAVLADALPGTPPAQRAAAFSMHFELRHLTGNAEAALTWSLQNAGLLTDGLTPESGPAVGSLHTAMNLAESALLKAQGLAAWEQAVAARLAAAPESPLALMNAACALEKIAETLAAAQKDGEAQAAISRAVQLVEKLRLLEPGLLDQSSREIFLANYADLARRTGEEIETVELVPLRAEWNSRAVVVQRPARTAPRRSEWLAGRSPLGWNAEGVRTEIPASWRSLVELKAEFLVEASSAPAFGCLYSAVSGTAAPFSLNGARLTWSDSGRPERTLPLDYLSSDKAAARAAGSARLTLCGPQWLREGQNAFSFTIVQPEPLPDSFLFDAALFALKLTWPQAVERAAKHGTLSPDFWNRLPAWITK